MQTIPLLDEPAQTVYTALGGQSCAISLYLKSTGMFCDLRVNGASIVTGVACQNLNRIVRDAYLGFVGDLVFNDTQGISDPVSPGLGTRYALIYLSPSDLVGV